MTHDDNPATEPTTEPQQHYAHDEPQQPQAQAELPPTSPEQPDPAPAQQRAPEPERKPAPQPEHWEYTIEVPPDTRAVGICRTAVRMILGAHGMPELYDRAAVLTSELLGNALRHTDGRAGLRLRYDDEENTLRIGVWDGDPTPPDAFSTAPHPLGNATIEAGPYDHTTTDATKTNTHTHTHTHTHSNTDALLRVDGIAESGRGLLLVALYADDWGWSPLMSGLLEPPGKYVWCDLMRGSDCAAWAAGSAA
ncbi:hypothetical protein [Streptomyces zagrosensis]|uniref:Anti-sigma regulatory factor (Ser/Thr protein kinase) n=1 Tax=Streptomyces zagrosensis TaxID=1042984 RepID=A0A7W9Q5Q5_9ACTN|nr:hypothetical protein [Streptomyces zagrosensis]MBB5933864.1 anti-sigma regulatory factor (Ser/Thr protein kinase) [Streptomyces zagrosensis]